MPIFSENDLNPLQHPIVFRMPHRDVASVWIEHVPFAFYVMAVTKPAVFVELGTLDGVSYCSFCQAVEELHLSTKCYAVNTWSADPHTGLSGGSAFDSLRQHHDPLYNQFSTLIQNTGDHAIEHFEDGTIDLLHIDSDQTYEVIKHDLNIWTPKLSRRGVVILHNVNEHQGSFGARKLFAELRSKHPSFEFFQGRGLGIVALGDEIPSEFLPFFQLSEGESDRVRKFFYALGQRLALNITLEEQKQVEFQLHRDLQSKNEQLKNMEQQIESIRASKAQVQKSLAELQQSIAVRFLMRYRAMLERFFPQGSNQRRFYDYLLKRTRFSAEPSKLNFSIIVFQMGKVGSRTVQESLIHAYATRGLPVNVYHSHILSGFDKAEEIIRRERPNPESTLGVIHAGRELRKMIDDSLDHHQWKIISLVRDPVARNVGTFFQVLEEHIPDWKKRYAEGTLKVEDVQKAFLNVGSIHTEPYRWFDEQLLPLTGVDVFKESFPRDTGYKIYNFDSKLPILVIRLEDLDRIGSLALQEFLGLDNIELINTNIGEEKEYADLYRLFKQNPLPDSYLQEIYNTKYARTFYTEAEIAKFSVKWQNTGNYDSLALETQQDPILVYQMGKVGSKTIEQSLIHYYQSRGIRVDIYHTHFLNDLDKMEKDAIDHGISRQGIQKIREAQEIKKGMEEGPFQHWRVISLVRDPVARNIASFFQSLSVNQFMPDWKERHRRGQLDIEELQDIFLGLGEEYHQYPATWFDTQLKPVFDIDVFVDAFPHQTGYKIYESAANARLLVIRMENISDCTGQALHEYLGLTDFKILNSNLGIEKDYADVYQRFKSLPLPAQYLEKMYNTKFARYFYNDKELNGLKTYWLAGSKHHLPSAFR